MPRLVAGPPSHTAPSTYKLAPSEAFIPESVTATFDGTGAGGTFLPTLSIYSQDGKLIARSPATQVAAGSSAEVTFAPLLRAAMGAAAASEIPSAISGLTSDTLVSDAFFHEQAFDPTAFLTNDPTRYTVETIGGRTGLVIHTVGSYMGFFTLHCFDTPGFRVAAPQNFTISADAGGGLSPFGGVFGGNSAVGHLDASVGGASWYVEWAYPFAMNHAWGPGDLPITISAQQATGVTLDTEPSFFVQWVSDDTFGF